MKKWVALILVVCLTTALFPLVQAEGEWTCSSCGKENARNFCTSCGAAKPMEEWVCPDCGNANRADDHFCGNCGKKKGGTYADLVGKYVTFGQFSMYADGTYDDIEWLVLDVDGSKALLLSRYGLIAMRYHDRDEDVTWATSTIRAWLNQHFYNIAFSEEARAAILTTQVDNSASQHFDFTTYKPELEKTQGGEDTLDQIFLLSFAEGEKYFGLAHGTTKTSQTNTMKPRAVATLYAKESGVYVSGGKDAATADGEPTCWWWLRSPGIVQKTGACVTTTGLVGCYRDQEYYSQGAVRPAMWVDLDQLTIGEGNQLMYPGMPTKRLSATSSPSPKPIAKATVTAEQKLQVQDLAEYAGLEMDHTSLKCYDDYTRYYFSGSVDTEDVVIKYMRTLADNDPDLSLSRVFDKSYYSGRTRYYSVTLVYMGNLNVPNSQKANFDDSIPKGAVSMYFRRDGDSIRGQIDIAHNVEFVDLGYRSDGTRVQLKSMPANSPSPKPTAKATAKPTAKATAKPTAKATAKPTPKATAAAAAKQKLEIQDLADYARNEMKYDSLNVHDDYTVRSFYGDKSAEEKLIKYMRTLADSNSDLSLSRAYDKSYSSRDRYYSVTLVYKGSLNVPNTLEGYDKSIPKGAVSLYFRRDGDSIRGQLKIARNAEFVDLGYRSNGTRVQLKKDISARFLESSLYGDLASLGMNQAVVLRGTDRYITDEVSFKVSNGGDKDEFRIQNYYGSESIGFTAQHNGLMTGDQLDKRIMGLEAKIYKYFDRIDDVFTKRMSYLFGVIMNRQGYWLQDMPSNGLESAEVYVYEWNKNADYAVIYVDMTFQDAPKHVEALARFSLKEAPGSRGNSNTVSAVAGATVKLEFTNREYMPKYELYKWEVLQGSSCVELSGVNLQTCSVKAVRSGQVVIRCTYSYGVDEPHALLPGRTQPAERTKTMDFTINIQPGTAADAKAVTATPAATKAATATPAVTKASTNAPANDDSWTCASCGNINDSKFCSECGEKKPEAETADANDDYYVIADTFRLVDEHDNYLLMDVDDSDLTLIFDLTDGMDKKNAYVIQIVDLIDDPTKVDSFGDSGSFLEKMAERLFGRPVDIKTSGDLVWCYVITTNEDGNECGTVAAVKDYALMLCRTYAVDSVQEAQDAMVSFLSMLQRITPKPTAAVTAKPTAKATAKPTATATATVKPTPQTEEGVVIGDAFRFLATADKGDEYVFLEAGEGYTLVFDFSHSENEADTYVLHVLDLIESGMDPKELKEIGSPADVLAVLAEASFGKKAKINTTGNFVWCYVINNDDGQSYGTLLALQDNALLMCETYGVASVEAAGDYMAAMLPMMTRITN